MKTPQIPPLLGMTPLGLKPTIYVIQDGGTFYTFDRNPHDITPYPGTPQSVRDVAEYAKPVKDFDMEAAREARAWFLEHATDIYDGARIVFLRP